MWPKGQAGTGHSIAGQGGLPWVNTPKVQTGLTGIQLQNQRYLLCHPAAKSISLAVEKMSHAAHPNVGCQGYTFVHQHVQLRVLQASGCQALDWTETRGLPGHSDALLVALHVHLDVVKYLFEPEALGTTLPYNIYHGFDITKAMACFYC
jgi:hypothetical protein